MKKTKLKSTEPGFWPAWTAKLMFTLISVKVWGLVACTTVSTWLLMVNLHYTPLVVAGKTYEYGINGAQWITFNTTIWALIFGMKEIFRIAEKRDQAESDALEKQAESKMAVAMVNAGTDPKEHKLTRGLSKRTVTAVNTTDKAGDSHPYEIVPDEPGKR